MEVEIALTVLYNILSGRSMNDLECISCSLYSAGQVSFLSVLPSSIGLVLQLVNFVLSFVLFPVEQYLVTVAVRRRTVDGTRPRCPRDGVVRGIRIE